jgi:hypothetical protein
VSYLFCHDGGPQRPPHDPTLLRAAHTTPKLLTTPLSYDLSCPFRSQFFTLSSQRRSNPNQPRPSSRTFPTYPIPKRHGKGMDRVTLPLRFTVSALLSRSYGFCHQPCLALLSPLIPSLRLISNLFPICLDGEKRPASSPRVTGRCIFCFTSRPGGSSFCRGLQSSRPGTPG